MNCPSRDSEAFGLDKDQEDAGALPVRLNPRQRLSPRRNIQIPPSVSLTTSARKTSSPASGFRRAGEDNR